MLKSLENFFIKRKYWEIVFIFIFMFILQIINKDNVQEGEMEENGYIISGGIIVIIRSAVIPDGTIL